MSPYFYCFSAANLKLVVWPLSAFSGQNLTEKPGPVFNYYLTLSGTNLHYLAVSDTFWHYLALSCSIWHYLALYCTIFQYLTLYGPIWNYIALYGTIWHYMALSCTIWHYLALSGPVNGDPMTDWDKTGDKDTHQTLHLMKFQYILITRNRKSPFVCWLSAQREGC